MRLVVIFEPRRIEDQPFGCFHISCHLRQLKLNSLESVDGLTKLFALRCIANRFLQGRAPATQCHRACNDAYLCQQLAQVGLTVTFLFAQTVAVRHKTVGQR